MSKICIMKHYRAIFIELIVLFAIDLFTYLIFYNDIKYDWKTNSDDYKTQGKRTIN